MRQNRSQKICNEVQKLIGNFEAELKSGDLRKKVLALVPVFRSLRGLGKSLIPHETASAARDRILFYFLKYPHTIIQGEELLVISGIQEYARRVRELRVQFGWSIFSGVTVQQMKEENEFEIGEDKAANMKPDEYVLTTTEQDRESAHRWNLANDIRRKKISVRDKILEFLKANVGKSVTGEELRYVANQKTEWARRVRELRTELGWPISTKNTGRPELPTGTYILQSIRQSPKHDRRIPDIVKSEVLRRDGYRCKQCGWCNAEWNYSDPRCLELHHVKPHSKGGQSIAKNLITLCTICHDTLHHKT